MNTLSIWQPSPPLPLIILDILIMLGILTTQIKPKELPIPMFLAIIKVAQKQIAVGINLNTPSTLLVIHKLPLVDFTLSCYVYTLALTTLLGHQPEIDLLVVFY
jgi:hypothetical protein